ncbi:MAG: hypothetical protein MJ001_04485 [Paludibacteraceae bacterium]|nr:hypothetical protein [Candidatus Colousia faecequi]MCQ2338167.1 hypothetical protein [Paludibacteraceae bacterium]
MSDILDNICDDSKCIAYILEHIDPKLNVTDNDIQYVLDLICEYYDENGLMDDSNDEAEIAEDDMLNFIMAAVRKEKIVNLSEEQLTAIIEQEYEFGKKEGLYE